MIINSKASLALILLISIPLSGFSAEETRSTMKLKPCPDSPNCVSSQSQSASQRISPLPYRSTPEEAMKRIKKIIMELPRNQLVKEKDRYLHVEFKTSLLKFIDDVEIIIDDAEKVIHLRSASRTGYWDLGVNRRRLEQIRNKYLK